MKVIVLVRQNKTKHFNFISNLTDYLCHLYNLVAVAVYLTKQQTTQQNR